MSWTVRRVPAIPGPVRVAAFLVSGAAAVAVAGLLLRLCGLQPLPLGAAVLRDGLGSRFGLEDLMLLAAPLVGCGLSVVVMLRVGLWNIGADGQFFVGAACATAVRALRSPRPGGGSAAPDGAGRDRRRDGLDRAARTAPPRARHQRDHHHPVAELRRPARRGRPRHRPVARRAQLGRGTVAAGAGGDPAPAARLASGRRALGRRRDAGAGAGAGGGVPADRLGLRAARLRRQPGGRRLCRHARAPAPGPGDAGRRRPGRAGRNGRARRNRAPAAVGALERLRLHRHHRCGAGVVLARSAALPPAC